MPLSKIIPALIALLLTEASIFGARFHPYLPEPIRVNPWQSYDKIPNEFSFLDDPTKVERIRKYFHTLGVDRRDNVWLQRVGNQILYRIGRGGTLHRIPVNQAAGDIPGWEHPVVHQDNINGYAEFVTDDLKFYENPRFSRPVKIQAKMFGTKPKAVYFETNLNRPGLTGSHLAHRLIPMAESADTNTYTVGLNITRWGAYSGRIVILDQNNELHIHSRKDLYINISPAESRRVRIYSLYLDRIKSNLRDFVKGRAPITLNHIAKLLGARGMLWFLPLHPTTDIWKLGAIGSPYSTTNHFRIHPKYGSMNDLMLVLREARKKRLSVMLDISTGHVGPDYYLSKDEIKEIFDLMHFDPGLIAEQFPMFFASRNNHKIPASHPHEIAKSVAGYYHHWFALEDVISIFRGDFAAAEDLYTEDTAHYNFRDRNYAFDVTNEKIKYCLEHRDVHDFDCRQVMLKLTWDFYLSVFKFWISKGVRGFRLDMPHIQSRQFWEYIINHVRDYMNIHYPREEVIFLPEALDETPRFRGLFDVLNLATHDWLSRDPLYAQYQFELERQRSGPEQIKTNVIESHDNGRFWNSYQGFTRFACALFDRNVVPSLYVGQEIGVWTEPHVTEDNTLDFREILNEPMSENLHLLYSKVLKIHSQLLDKDAFQPDGERFYVKSRDWEKNLRVFSVLRHRGKSLYLALGNWSGASISDVNLQLPYDIINQGLPDREKIGPKTKVIVRHFMANSDQHRREIMTLEKLEHRSLFENEFQILQLRILPNRR